MLVNYGRASYFAWLLLLALSAAATHALLLEHNTGNLCKDSRCNCDSQDELSVNVTCRCSPQDKEATLVIKVESSPLDMSKLVISGCREVSFQSHALKGRSHLTDIRITDVGTVDFKPHSVGSLNGQKHPTVSVSRCRDLSIRSGAFANNIEKPLTFSADNCQSVTVEESAFSRIRKISFYAIPQLHLAADAFRFTKVDDESMLQGDISIEQCHLVGGLKSFTFPSPFSQLRLNNVSLETIHPNATTAVRIFHMHIYESRIDNIAEQAFSEFTHLDTVEIRNSRIGAVSSRAVRSAISSFVLSDNQIGSLNEDGVSITAATVLVQNNHLRTMKTGSLNLREWNNLLVENNTFDLVEKHAFFRIGEPKSEYSQENIRFVIKSNTVLQAETGAFIFSAKASRLDLADNYFQHNCECTLDSWAADLTRVTRTFTASETLSSDPTDALWLGTTLYNSSYCRLSQAESECRGVEENFIPMSSYTTTFCPRNRNMTECIRAKQQANVQDNSVPLSGMTTSRYNENTPTPLYIILDQNLLVVIILAAAVAVALAGMLFGIILTRRKKKRTDPMKRADNEEMVTRSPLLCAPSEKHFGSGVVSSGSISRLAVKDYRSYLEDSGPIYSEPLDPPNSKISQEDLRVELVPPEIPAFPPEWTPKFSESVKRETSLQTEVQPQQNDEFPESVADEFAADIFSALQDKMDLSPTYCEVRDALDVSRESKEEKIPKVKTFAELYDSIQVIEPKERPSTSSVLSEHIYCKPWNERESFASGNSGLSPAMLDSPLVDEEVFAFTREEDGGKLTGPVGVEKIDKPFPAKAEVPKSFNNRGSLPKWPPPSRSNYPTSSLVTKINTNPAISKSIVSGPLSKSFRETKTPLRNHVQRSHSSSTTVPKPARKSLAHLAEQNRVTENASDGQSGPNSLTLVEEYANPKDETMQFGSSLTDLENEEYSEVNSNPVSLNLPNGPDRKPNFSTQTRIDRDRSAPPKPWRKPMPELCDYAEPKDRAENLYSELQNH